MAFGIHDLKSVIRIPVNWDLAYLRQWQTADGVTWDRVVARLGAAITLFNRSLITGPWASFIRVTTDMTVGYRLGEDSGELPPMPEHNRPDLFAGAESGHMIPMRDYGGGLGWTSLALRRASMANLDLGVQTLIDRGGTTWRKRLFERLFKKEVDRVGTSGVSMPFADGGTADSEYIPTEWEGVSFDDTHNHYFRETDDATGRTAFIEAGVNTLREHGIMPPYILTIPEVDATLWAAQTEVVPPERSVILTQGLDLRSVVPDPDLYIGVFEASRGWGYVMPTPRLPANYAGMFKPYGFGNVNNPLVVRHEAGFPLGLSLEGQVIIYPLQEAVAMMTFGVGVGNRLNGALCYFAANGDYVSPTIT
jgi:hypothetical protein